MPVPQYLEDLARRLRLGDETAAERFGVLSTGEKIFVALAGCKLDLLPRTGYSRIDEAWRRLGPEWQQYVTAAWEDAQHDYLHYERLIEGKSDG